MPFAWRSARGFSAAAALIGANKRSFYGDYNKSRVVATISKSM